MDTIMPFGKYKGMPVSELPLDYLRWLSENCELRGELIAAVDFAINGPSAARPAPKQKPEAIRLWQARLLSKYSADLEIVAALQEAFATLPL
jgi:hypothetical protein